jgi:AraC family transcriptional activator FtrA
MIVDSGSNPFELGVGTELFGLRRPEPGDRPWYSFTLAHAGLLDGRRATTHWKWAGLFREMFPQVTLVPDVLYTQDGPVHTAAGSAAALDLGLHLIRQDHGTEVVNAVSRRLVFAAHRDGGQRQFVTRPVPEVPDDSLAEVLGWARECLGEPLTVAQLAARAAVSQATLHRRFQAELGTTPLAWLTAERVELARSLIERGESRLEVVARRSGLGSASNLRAQFHRRTGLTPSAYRRRFGPPAAAAPAAVAARTAAATPAPAASAASAAVTATEPKSDVRVAG